MGLFSKLIKEGSGLSELIKDVKNVVKQESVNLHESEMAETETTYHTAEAPRAESTYSSADEQASGFSWGPVMPAEENQFNYSGTYKEYFSNVFSSEFPSYRIESSDVNNGRATVFTFWDGSRKALVVELLSEKSAAQKLRSDCLKENIPYLRYYYDHHGWWNTRAYVKERTRNALGG